MSTTSRWYDQIERYEGVSMDSAEAILTKSQAISLKRIADALEIIAAADRLSELERENARLREALFETHLDLVAYADIDVARKRLVKRRAALAGSGEK